MSPPMIEATNLTRTFGALTAVDSLSFAVQAGGVVGFLGPNGAGKTTTIRMMTGFLPPTSGRLTVGGVDLSVDPLAARRMVGYLPESTPLYTDMRVRDYLTFRAKLDGLGGGRRRAAVRRAIDRCHLGDVRKRLIGHCSKGFRQRVGLAAALVKEPPVIILDEPTVGLDPRQMHFFRDLVRSLAGDHTIVLSTHLLHEAEKTCDTILMMNRGRLRAAGSVAEIRQRGAARTRIRLEVDGPTREEATAILAGLPGVASSEPVSADDGGVAFDILPVDAATDLRPILAASVTSHGWKLRELHRGTTSLEELFLDLVEPDGTTAGTPTRTQGAA